MKRKDSSLHVELKWTSANGDAVVAVSECVSQWVKHKTKRCEGNRKKAWRKQEASMTQTKKYRTSMVYVPISTGLKVME